MKVWASILCFLWIGAAEAATRKLDYKELPTLIRQNNPGIQAAESSVESARQRAGALDRSFLPRLGLESGVRGQKEADGSGAQAPYWKLDAVSNLYRGGRDAWKDQEIETQIELRKLDTQIFMRHALMQVRADYVQLAAIRQLMQLNTDITQSSRQKRKSLRQKIQAGLLAESFATDFLLFEQGLEQDLLFLEKEMHEVEDRLVLVLGLAPETTLQLESLAAIEMGPAPSPSLVKELAELKKLELEARTLRAAATLPAEWWRPEIDLFASYASLQVEEPQPGPLPSRESAIGLRFTLNLEESAKSRKDSTRLQSEAATLDLQKADRTRAADLEVHEYFHDIQALRPILVKLDQHVKSAEILQKRIVAEFERGVRDSSAVLESMRRLHDLKKRRIESQREHHEAQAGLQTFLRP